MADAAVAYRYETAARPKGLQWEDWMARTMTRLNAALDDLEANWMDVLGEVNAGSIARGRGARPTSTSACPTSAGATGGRSLPHWHEGFSRRESMEKTSIKSR